MTKKKKPLMLLIAGLLLIAFSQILARYIELSDIVKGILTGIGFGLLVVALITTQNRLRIKN